MGDSAKEHFTSLFLSNVLADLGGRSLCGGVNKMLLVFIGSFLNKKQSGSFFLMYLF